MVPLSHLVMGFDNPFMPRRTFSPAMQDMQRWNGFSQTDISSIAHQNAASLYPALADRLPQAAAAEKLDAWWASNRDCHVCRDRGRSPAGRKPALLASANSTPAQAYNHRLERMTSSDCTCKT
jgi:hypothetical protein